MKSDFSGTWLACCLIGLAAISGACDSRVNRAEDEPRRLTLVKSRSFVLPDSFYLAGASATPDGSVVAWAHNQSFVLLGRADTVRHISLKSLSQPIAAAILGDSLLEVIDSGGMHTLPLSGVTSTRAYHEMRFHGTVLAAARTNDGRWLVAIRQNRRVVLRRITGGVLSTTQIPVRWDPADRFTLSSRDSDVIVAFREPSRGLWILNSLGEIVQRSVPSSTVLFSSPDAGDATGWFAMQAVPIGSELIQTIVNPTSGERIMLALRSDGSLIRTSRVTGLFGLTGSDIGKTVVVGARLVGKAEIVVYRARWHVAPQSISETK